MAAEHRVHLAPPPRLVEAAKSVMGAIDFDPWSNKEINRLVNAAKIFDRDKLDLDTVLAKEWELPGEKGLSSLPAHGAQWTRRLANKALREYRKGRIDQALLWISHNESLTKLPWMWEYPVCIPFRRLRPATSMTSWRHSAKSIHQAGQPLFTYPQLILRSFTPGSRASTTHSSRLAQSYSMRIAARMSGKSLRDWAEKEIQLSRLMQLPFSQEELDEFVTPEERSSTHSVRSSTIPG